jgi:hypothetical protein
MRITLTIKQILIDLGLTLLSGIIVGLLLRGCDDSSQPLMKTHSTSTERSVNERPDSASVQVSLPALSMNVRGKGRLGGQAFRRLDDTNTKRLNVQTPDPISCFDTIGYFSHGSQTDTISVCHNMKTDSFYLSVKLAPRTVTEVIHYVARDSLVIIRDSVYISLPNERSWYHDPSLVLGGFSIGSVLGVVLGFFLSR